MKGIDISHFQGKPFNAVTKEALKDCDFAFVKATQGTSKYKYEDYFYYAIDLIIKAGLLPGTFHYANGKGAKAEAEYFISIVEPIIEKTEGNLALALDWETSELEAGKNYSWGSTTYAKQFMDIVYKKTGKRCFLYTGNTGVTQCKNCYPDYKLWFAGYPKGENSWTVPAFPSRYKTAPWPKYDIWQFTNGGEKLDRDITNMTKSQWLDYVNPKKIITPATNTTEKETKVKVSIDFSKYKNKISNSGHDERGKYSGGTAGDQTKQEWAIINWYSRPWTCVLRHPNKEVRELIAELSIKAANNNNIGYDQNQRNTYWTQLQKVKYDPSKITTKCEADCSAGVIANTKAVGYLKNISALKNLSATYTGNMKSGFKSAGFQILTDSKYLTTNNYLVPGDILLYEGHHTATNLGIGSKSNYTQSAAATKTTTVTSTATKATTTPKIIPTYSKKWSKTVIRTGEVNTGLLNVRSGPGLKYKNIISYPTIANSTKVGICMQKVEKDSTWYYVKISGKKGDKYGFVSAKYIKLI